MARSWMILLGATIFLAISTPIFAGTYSGGSGTLVDPYQIASADDLITLGKTTDDYGKCFILTADIDLSGQGPNADGSFPEAVIAPYGWNTGEAFSGHFNGKGHEIRNLIIISRMHKVSYLGLFGYIRENALLENIGVEEVTIIGGEYSSYIGGLCGS